MDDTKSKQYGAITKHQQKFLRFECQRPSVALLYINLGLLAGFFSNRQLNSKAKFIWRFMSVSAVVNNIGIGYPGYILTAKELDIPNLLYTTAVSCTQFYTLCFIPSVVKYFEHELETTMSSISASFGCQEPERRVTDVRHRKYDTIVAGTYSFAWLFGMELLYCILTLLYAVALCDESCLQKQEIYLLATPYLEYIRLYRVFFTIYLIQTYTILMIGITLIFVITFCLMLSCEFYNAHVNLCIHLERMVNNAVSNLRDRQAEMSTRLTDVESEQLQQFGNDLGKIVKQRQTLTRAIRILKPFMEIFSSINVITFFVVNTIVLFLILRPNYASIMRVKLIIALMLVIFTLYSTTYSSKLFEEANDLLAQEVYCTQWYELPPEYRKMMYIFLCQTQRPDTFFVLKMYPISMTMFAKSMRFVYTLVNLLGSTMK